MSREHPDLLALLEGRLSPEQAAAARRHLESCPACREEERQLRATLESLEGVLEPVRRALSEAGAREEALAEALGPEDEPELAPEEVVPELPPELRRRLRGGEEKGTLASRLQRSLEVVAGLGREAARRAAERILGGEAMPAAAPAIRRDAAEVDQEDESEPEGEERGE